MYFTSKATHSVGAPPSRPVTLLEVHDKQERLLFAKGIERHASGAVVLLATLAFNNDGFRFS